MKVLHLIDSGGFYGAEAMLLTLCQEQRKVGIDAQVLSIGSPGDYEKAVELRLRELNVPVHIVRMRPLPNFFLSARLAHWAHCEGFELLHSHGYKGNILFGLLPRNIRKLPLVSTLHGWTRKPDFKMRVYEYLDKLALRKISALAIVNPLMAEFTEIKSLENRIPIHVVENGINTEQALPDTDILNLIQNFKGKGRLIGSIGRLSQEKGFDVLIRAFAKLYHKFNDVRLCIIGDGPERESLEKICYDLEISKYVYFAGYLNSSGDYLSVFDCFVNSSHTEGFPITLLEAMKFGCPIIASDIPQLRYIVEGGKLGLLVSDRNESGFFEALEVVMKMPHQAMARAYVARQRFLEKYTGSVMCSRYNSLYEICHL